MREEISGPSPCKLDYEKKEKVEVKLIKHKNLKRKNTLPMNQIASKVKRQGKCLAEGKERAIFIRYFFNMLIGLQFSSSLPKIVKGVMKTKPPKNH